MTTTTDAAKAIREELKAAGIKARSVSVRSDLYSMGSTIRILVKDAGVSLAVVKAIAAKHERIDRDSATGEILSGGNRFIDVEYAREVTAALAAPFLPTLLAMPADGTAVELTGEFRAVALRPHWNPNDERVIIFRAGDFDHPVVHCHGREFAARQLGILMAEGGR